jgi:hypothetical protein
MPFVDEIVKYKSVSFVGMEKNTGKTECLNYVLKRLEPSSHRIAITSIGIDGEGLDLVTQTHKPEIQLSENNIFITSEAHYHSKKLDAIILNISKKRTSLGRLVTAKAISKGKVMLSGPPDTVWLKKILNEMELLGVETTLVDGALSRQSLGSPAITQSMILTTGAAVSVSIPHLITATAFTYDLIRLPLWEGGLNEQLLATNKGIFAIGNEGYLHDLDIESAFLLEAHKEKLFTFGTVFFVSGVLTNSVLNFLRIQKKIEDTIVIVKDFTHIFAQRESVTAFLKKGGKIFVLLRTNLISVCLNPVSPQGYVLPSEKVCAALSEKLQIPVYDIRKL